MTRHYEWDLAFLSPWPVSFCGASPEERPLGGSETAIVELARRFAARGLRVAVFGHVPEGREGRYEGVDYLTIGPVEAMLARGLALAEQLVVSRDPTRAPLGRAARRTLLWIEDMPMEGLRKQHREALPWLDGIVAVSRFQRDRFVERFDIPPDRFLVSRNGVDQHRFPAWGARVPGRLVYASTPFRGLAVLLQAFPLIRARHPEVTLHLYSGMALYDQSDAPFAALYERARATEGVTLHAPVPQPALVRALSEAELLVYPSVFDESSCIAVMMAIAAGAVPVTSPRAALPETVGDCGLLVSGDARQDSDYPARFAHAVGELLDARDRLAALRARCRARCLDWAPVVDQWLTGLS